MPHAASTGACCSISDRVTGAVLYGDTSGGRWYLDLIEKGESVASLRNELLFGEPKGRAAGGIMTAAEARTTCPYCGVGCGVLAKIEDGVVRVRGDPPHPANHGALCSKGSALGETVGLEGRLLRPRVLGEEVGWDAALDAVARRFRRASSMSTARTRSPSTSPASC